ncbi:MAG: putative phosphoesterase [Idiomarinaceae bacterium HL-53]|nr:MAG: putative phosphoesterase [Idiomarinaceae bacterium HL-53]CUS48026.1 Calcineurin-like phosphoesterase [Idiomarinaceae bacterium HL-53]
MFDIIGDIHGYGDKLELLLAHMGYEHRNGVRQHPERTLISVGDLVDRGPFERKTVDIIRSMVEAGSALAIMGNHEFNAVAWATQSIDGEYLRPHTEKNFAQHEAFLKEAEADPAWYHETIEWFKTLPFYLDFDAFRIVHACWHAPSIETLNRYCNAHGALVESAWEPANEKGHELYEAIEVLCKGWEIPLPAGVTVNDFANHPRAAIRTKWWLTEEYSYRKLAMGVPQPESLPDIEVPEGSMPGYDQKKPLFIGHYWMKGTPALLTPHIACLDWSVAQGGPLVAYRYDQPRLNEENFVWV